MGGINGYLQFSKIKNEKDIYNLVNQMNKEAIHRGPDGQDIYVDEFVGLGIRFLCNIDSYLKNTIIFNEDRTMLIIVDGSIFNYNSLKSKLETMGHKFSTSDSIEVILHAYEEYGEKCFKYFDGIFSFAIYDINKRELLLARDRVGQKPLHYYKNNDFLIFGSELKSLLSTNLIEKEINEEALHQYLQLTYIPAPYTIFKNIHKINPGSYLKIDLDANIYIEQYWDVLYDNGNIITGFNECKKLLRETVFNSVEARMKNGGTIGAFLSGGIDSTIIVGVMSNLSSEPINTFTMGFKSKDFNESDRAQLVADRYKTNHHIYYLDYEDVLEKIDIIVNQLDEPFADSSSIPTYMISEFASQHVNTVLTGDAGDELFAGYSKYLINYYSDLYKKVPPFIRNQVIEKMVKLIPDNKSLTRKLHKVIDNVDKDIFSQRRELMCLGFKENELKLLLKQQNKRKSLDFINNYYDKYKDDIDEISQTLYTDLKVVIEGDMMPKIDRMATLAQLGTRAPLLSQGVIELSAQIPSKYKINNRDQKIILKDTFNDIIPSKLINASKRGFGVPIGHWLKGPLKKELLQLLEENYIVEQGLFEPEYINKVLEEHFSEKKNRTSELWLLFVFQRWYRRYFVI